MTGLRILCCIGLLYLFPGTVSASDIRNTKHNLSISGPGPISAARESRICIFCHVPHQADSTVSYLWNRSAPVKPFTPYYSSTLKADVGQPTGASRMCLSCHDGTIALGATASSATEIPFKGGIRELPAERSSNIGTDLSDDHPVSFVYDDMLVLKHRQLRDPSTLPSAIGLEGHWLECTACHDPHDNTYGRFLVMDNAASSLCIACHDMENWPFSVHARSSKSLNRTGGLWPNTDFATVGENGCENCHTPHQAGSRERLLIFAYEEDNCLACHNGAIAVSDLASALIKPYGHGVHDTAGIHAPDEDFVDNLVAEHVECSDCHNAHQASSEPSPGKGIVSGANKGVSGITAMGQSIIPARYQYEICFKCHGSRLNLVSITQPVARQHNEPNKRLTFNAVNPSFHPVEDRGKNPYVPSLLAPLTADSIITCTDCHAGGDSLEFSGPHGSIYPHILRARYVTEDYTAESAAVYALCYQCHNRSALLNDTSFEHRVHVVENNAPCSACHDPHGVSFMQGTPVNNSHLINFDITIVSANSNGRREYIDQGRLRGQCFLTCHGKIHDPMSYPE